MFGLQDGGLRLPLPILGSWYGKGLQGPRLTMLALDLGMHGGEVFLWQAGE